MIFWTCKYDINNFFLIGRKQDYVAHSKGERASIVQHKDNLKMEGKMEARAAKVKAIAAEKASRIKHEDNLKLEGSMEGMQRRGTITLSSNKENGVKHEDNLKMEGSFESRSASAVTQKSTMGSKVESTYSSTSNLSQTTALKSNQSSGITGAMHQTGKESAAISAISKDKFVSSLRESNGMILGQQKEMSVIDHHRKQSLQKQQRETWDTRATGYAVGEAHTGRTAAYGGRDYEYSSNMMTQSRSASSAAASTAVASRQSHSANWMSAEQSSSSARMSSAHQSRASISSQHQSSLSSSAHHQSSSSSSTHHQSSSSMSAVQQQSSSGRASRQDHSGLSGFRQEQVSGYARNLGTSQSGAALIKNDQVIRHEASSSASAYQSVAQQSYRGQQSESRMERTTPSRRRTWAESSLMHGGAATIGQSIYAQDFHQHSCPASKVYTQTSPYKYERQSSSGHKLFKERGDLNQTR